MKTFIGTKIIKAKPMTRAVYNTLRGWALPADEDGNDEGYLVEYQDGGKPNLAGFDGYVSWSLNEVFDAAYRALQGPDQALTFGDAVVMLKDGKRVARFGWNGSGMFAYLVPAAAYPVQTGAAKAHFGEGSMVPYNAYLAIKTVAETVSTWVPSVNDVLAEDWYALD